MRPRGVPRGSRTARKSLCVNGLPWQLRAVSRRRVATAGAAMTPGCVSGPARTRRAERQRETSKWAREPVDRPTPAHPSPPAAEVATPAAPPEPAAYPAPEISAH